MPVALVIFDCDGVIADSEVLSASVMIAQLAELGLSIGPDDVRRDFLGRSFPTVAKVIRERFNHELPEEFEAEYRRRLLLRFEDELAPTPGFTDMLAKLRKPCCVATSSSRPRVERTLQLLGVSKFFGPHVFTASQVTHGKPAPDLFLFTASQMNVAPGEVLVIEDSLPGIAAARSAGMRVLAYHGGSHLRGHPQETPADVQSFDNWDDFPHLLKDIDSFGEIR